MGKTGSSVPVYPPKKERLGLGACDGASGQMGMSRRSRAVFSPRDTHQTRQSPQAVNVVAVDMVTAAVVERLGCGGGFTLTQVHLPEFLSSPSARSPPAKSTASPVAAVVSFFILPILGADT